MTNQNNSINCNRGVASFEEEVRTLKSRRENSQRVMQEVQLGIKSREEVFKGRGKDIETKTAECPGCGNLTFGWNEQKNSYCCGTYPCAYIDSDAIDPITLRRFRDIGTPTSELKKLDTYNILGLR